MAEGTAEVRVMQVVHVRVCRGKGTSDSLVRTVEQYFDFEGNLLAESDPCIPVRYRYGFGHYVSTEEGNGND